MRLYTRFPQHPISSRDDELCRCPACGRATTELDLGIIEKPLSAATVERYPLMSDQLVLAAIRQSDRGSCENKVLGLLLYERYLEEQNIQTPILQIANNEMIVALWKKGFGCSIISARAARDVPHEDLGERYRRQFI